MNTVIITNASELDEIQSGLKANTRIRLALPGLEGLASELAQQKLSRLASPCGCTQGAIGLLTGIGLSLASLPLSTSWPVWLSLVVVGTLTGKLIGLQMDKKALKAEIRHLKQYA